MFTNDSQVPREFKAGSVVVPSVWVKLAGLALTFGVIAGVGHLLGL